MKKRLLIIALALIMVLSTACASNPAPATDPTRTHPAASSPAKPQDFASVKPTTGWTISG